ncbi:hypothetical protein ACFV2X_48095 [Streptomyces sp. NPDC059679]|uniref:hypothetical protein n=1 Tax=Streptomyces sp. NPDC059679 TaxID=3346903 RepID=UPI0036A3DA6E
MAIKNRAEVLWRAWIGDTPRTVGERVRLLGGAQEAARHAGVTPGTVRRWIRKEESAMPTTVKKAVETFGGVDEAARRAGVTPRTIKAWQRKEERGQAIGNRQAQHIAKLTDAAVAKHTAGLAAQRPKGNQAKLHQAVLASPQARKEAMSSRRAARISHSGAHLSISAQVMVDTGRRKDVRWREINLNFRNDIMSDPTNAFLAGNDEGAISKLGDAFGEHYAPGTGWQFGEIRSMEIKEFGAGPGGTFPSI